MTTQQLVSIRAFARLIGVSHTAVRKAVASGRISTVNGRIDPEVAKQQWQDNTDHARRREAWEMPNGQAPVLNLAPAAQDDSNDLIVPVFPHGQVIEALEGVVGITVARIRQLAARLAKRVRLPDGSRADLLLVEELNGCAQSINADTGPILASLDDHLFEIDLPDFERIARPAAPGGKEG